jgi:hypothetical protein
MPAAVMAFILSAAVPWPPLMIAPAWPMRRPGGAVCPAMKPTTGFFTCCFTNSAAASSADPPISPIMMMASVSGSSLSRRSASMCVVPMIGSPPMPIAVDCPMPRCVKLMHGLIGQRARARDDPDRAFLVNAPGMMPILALPGEITPGQLGPISRDFES